MQAFDSNVTVAIKAHRPGFTIAGNKGHSIGTKYVVPYAFDFHYSDSNFIPDPSDWWDASRAHRAQQSAFLSHPNINMTKAQRRVLIGLSYGVGAHLIAPWDEWLSGENPRLYADPADFADLYGFARSLGQRGYLNGYEDAAVGGYDLLENRYAANPPLSVSGGSGLLSVFARAQPGEAAAPVVLHLVESGTAQAATLRVRIDSLFNSANVECTLFTPSAYDETTHSTANTSGDYASLAQYTTLPSDVDGDELVINLPALSPWAVLVIASKYHRINISPATAQVFTGESQGYTATIVDSSGSPISPQPSINWSVDTGGSISTDGLFSAGASPATGTVTASATLEGEEGLTGSQIVQVIDGTEQEITARWSLNGDANDSVGNWRDEQTQGWTGGSGV